MAAEGAAGDAAGVEEEAAAGAAGVAGEAGGVVDAAVAAPFLREAFAGPAGGFGGGVIC